MSVRADSHPGKYMGTWWFGRQTGPGTGVACSSSAWPAGPAGSRPQKEEPAGTRSAPDTPPG